jgi:peptidoglycan/LPS O-acetylase OafA/YrhL
MHKSRLLFFDIIRIVSILAIVLFHIGWKFGIDDARTWVIATPIWGFSLASTGVLLLIFVSGAVLTCSNYSLNTVREVIAFYSLRMIRLYPAYWMSIIIAIVFSPSLLQLFVATPFLQLSGFMELFGNGAAVNFVGWFIGEMVILYLLFPIMSRLIKQHPYGWTAVFILISIISMNVVGSIALTYAPDNIDGFIRWFPPCYLIWFALGIFIVQMGLYPKYTYKSETLFYFAELSFYVFLFHTLVDPTFMDALNMVEWRLLLLSFIFLISAGAMYIDGYLQHKIKIFISAIIGHNYDHKLKKINQ